MLKDFISYISRNVKGVLQEDNTDTSWKSGFTQRDEGKNRILNLNFLEIWDRFLKITEDCRVYNVHHKGEM